jgi:hypothetical protein
LKCCLICEDDFNANPSGDGGFESSVSLMLHGTALHSLHFRYPCFPRLCFLCIILCNCRCSLLCTLRNPCHIYVLNSAIAICSCSPPNAFRVHTPGPPFCNRGSIDFTLSLGRRSCITVALSRRSTYNCIHICMVRLVCDYTKLFFVLGFLVNRRIG